MNDEKTFEQKINDFGRWVSRHITTIFAVLISLFFIFSGTVKVLPTELALKEQIIMAFVNIVAGYSITNLIGEQGFTSARLDPDFKRQCGLYEDAVKKGTKYREAIDEFAKDKARVNLKNLRRNICESVGLYYFNVFDEEGNLKNDFDITVYKGDKNYLKKVHAYNKCVRLTIQDASVFSRSGGSRFGTRKRKTVKGYRTKKGITGAITKILLGTVSIGVMFVFIGWSWGAAIYAFMQVALWSGMGVIDRQKNYNFMMEEIMPQYTDDRLVIEEFMEKTEPEQQYYIKKAEENNKQIKQIPYHGV